MPATNPDPIVVPAITLGDLKDAVDNLSSELRDADGHPYSDRQIERALAQWLDNHIRALTENLERSAVKGITLAPLKLPEYSDIDWVQEAYYARVDYEYDRLHDR